MANYCGNGWEDGSMRILQRLIQGQELWCEVKSAARSELEPNTISLTTLCDNDGEKFVSDEFWTRVKTSESYRIVRLIFLDRFRADYYRL